MTFVKSKFGAEIAQGMNKSLNSVKFNELFTPLRKIASDEAAAPEVNNASDGTPHVHDNSCADDCAGASDSGDKDEVKDKPELKEKPDAKKALKEAIDALLAVSDFLDDCDMEKSASAVLEAADTLIAEAKVKKLKETAKGKSEKDKKKSLKDSLKKGSGVSSKDKMKNLRKLKDMKKTKSKDKK